MMSPNWALPWALALLAAAQDTTQRLPCNEEAARQAASMDDPRAYGPRGNRCEGVYDKEFAARPPREVYLLGLFTRPPGFRIDGVRPLAVRWPRVDLAGDGGVRLLGQSKRPRKFYRMDAEAPLREGFVWPTDVLNSVPVTPGELALLAWIERHVDDVPERVYLPLHLEDIEPGTGDDVPFPELPGTRRIRVEFRATRDVLQATLDLRVVGTEDALPPYVRAKPVVAQSTGRLDIYELEVELSDAVGVHRVSLNMTLADEVPGSLSFLCAVGGAAGESDSAPREDGEGQSEGE